MVTKLCESCDKHFESERDEAEAYAEFNKNFPSHDGSDLAVVCADCYTMFMDWLDEQNGN